MILRIIKVSTGKCTTVVKIENRGTEVKLKEGKLVIVQPVAGTSEYPFDFSVEDYIVSKD
jgi:hypothetical protein